MPFKSEKQRAWMWANDPEMARKWQSHTPKGKKLPKYVKKKKKRKKTKADYAGSIVRLASLRRQGLLNGDNPMTLQDISGFSNYTPEAITELRHNFADQLIESRPIKYNDVILWVDGLERLHRANGPAVERADGSEEFWVDGVKKNNL